MSMTARLTARIIAPFMAVALLFCLALPVLAEPAIGGQRANLNGQESRGSVDEKLPFLYRNAILAMPETQVIIVIDGPGWRPGAIEWLKQAATTGLLVAEKQQKTVRVFSFEEFTAWVERLYPPPR